MINRNDTLVVSIDGGEDLARQLLGNLPEGDSFEAGNIKTSVEATGDANRFTLTVTADLNRFVAPQPEPAPEAPAQPGEVGGATSPATDVSTE